MYRWFMNRMHDNLGLGPRQDRSSLTRLKHRFIRDMVLEIGLPIGLVTAVDEIFIASTPADLGIAHVFFLAALDCLGFPIGFYLMGQLLWLLGWPQKFEKYLKAEED
ncbi:MAG: hypothetical protein NVS4B3_25990 [Gemmatimonadaceae bacterium]